MCWYVKDSEILDFLYNLAKDDDKLEKYKQDPQAVMEEACLSEEQQAALLTRNKDKILYALAGDFTYSADV